MAELVNSMVCTTIATKEGKEKQIVGFLWLMHHIALKVGCTLVVIKSAEFHYSMSPMMKDNNDDDKDPKNEY